MMYLILGANGLIGQQFIKLCKENRIEYAGTRYSREANNLSAVNFLEPKKLKAELEQICPHPSVVFNCVNLAGGVNFCENKPELAKKLHIDALKVLVDWCIEKKAIFVNFSTDYVFDGENPPYKEEDQTHPLNLYGRLKLEGEQYIQNKMKRYIIARTTNVYGWDPDTPTPNFLMYLYQTLRDGQAFNTPSFLYGNPTYAMDLAQVILELIDNNNYGLFHIVGSGYIDRYQWALKFCKLANLDEKMLKEIKEPPQNMVPRPLRSHLNIEKVTGLIRTKLHGVDEGLQLLIQEMKRG